MGGKVKDDRPDLPLGTGECSVCGNWTQGRQWRNKLPGHGLCGKCAVKERKKKTKRQMEETHGIDGVHYKTNRDGVNKW